MGKAFGNTALALAIVALLGTAFAQGTIGSHKQFASNHSTTSGLLAAKKY